MSFKDRLLMSGIGVVMGAGAGVIASAFTIGASCIAPVSYPVLGLLSGAGIASDSGLSDGGKAALVLGSTALWTMSIPFAPVNAAVSLSYPALGAVAGAVGGAVLPLMEE